jgi:hypothetical protein
MTVPSRAPESPGRRPAVAIALAVLAGAALAATPGGASAADAPPGRAYERVTPVDTNDDGVKDYTAQFFHAVDDDTVITGGAVAPSPRGAASPGGLSALSLARRTGAGWRSTPLLPPTAPSGATFQPEGSSLDGTSIVLFRKNGQFTTGPTVTVPQQLIHRGADGGFTVLDDIGDPSKAPAGEAESLAFGGISADGRTVVYSATKAPTGLGSPTGVPEARRFQVYRWRTDGTQEALGVDASGAPLSSCGVSMPGETYDFTTGAGTRGFATNALSSDGTTAFVQSPSPAQTSGGGACDGEPSQVWATGDGGAVELSAPRAGATPRDATFFGASPDGGHAYFATTSAIADDDPDDRSNDLYRWDAPAGGQPATRTCVSCGLGGPLTGDVIVSPNGERAFFSLRAGSGSDLWVADRSGTRVAVRATPEIAAGALYANSRFGTSYDGRVFVFQNTRRVPTDPVVTGRGGALYRGVVGTTDVDVRCLSCAGSDRDEPRPAFLGFANGFAALSPPGAVVGGVTQVSDDGRTIAFASGSPFTGPDSTDLSGQAPKGTYVWEDGVISTVAAIGATSSESYGTTRTGGSVFTLSASRLSPDAQDDSHAFYVARRGGGFAPPAPPPPGCDGESCRPSSPSGVAPVVPGSTAPAATGNAAPAPTPAAPRVVVTTPSAAVRRALAAGRSARIRVRVATAGTVRVRGTARIARRTRTIASASVRARVGSASVRLRLTAAARRELRRAGRLRVTLTTTQSGAATRRLTFTITRKAR